MEPMEVHSSDVILRGVVSESAAGGRETILFVHGFPDCRQTWSKQLAALAGEYRVAAFNLRGVNDSTAPRSKSSYRAVHMNADLEAIIDALVGEGGKVHLVGHDWGAMISWRFVSEPRLAKRIASFTAMAGPHPDLIRPALAGAFEGGFLRGLVRLAFQSVKSMYIWNFQLPFLPEFVMRYLGAWGWKRGAKFTGLAGDAEMTDFTREEFAAMTVNAINIYRQWIRGNPMKRREVHVGVPAQLIVPVRDFAISPYLYRPLADVVPSLRVVELDANHWGSSATR